METARTQLLCEDTGKTTNRWSCVAEEMFPTGVGSGDTTLLIASHTAGDIGRERSFCVSIR